MKIAVAVSGGVDSGTALALLKEQNHDLLAVFTDYFPCGESGQTEGCCSMESVRLAAENAEYLSVPFFRLDLTKEFNDRVIKPFIEYYGMGLTPNPCVWCNSRLRFTILMDKLLSMGYEYFATGHYARLNETSLMKAVDPVKDQSYFLYGIDKQRYHRIIFPLGSMLKKEVCRIASEKKLPVRKSKESQDCCLFMGDDMEKYMGERLEVRAGDILNTEGETIGEHAGYQNYTIGQRKGLGGLGRRSYVLSIEPETNRLIVGDKDLLYKNETSFRVLNMENFQTAEGETLAVKLRSTQKPASCTVTKLDFKGNICKISFKNAQLSPVPGQSAVLYRGQEVVGGGEIL